MSRRWQTCILCIASVALLAFVTSLILVGRASTKPSPPADNNLGQRPPNKIRNLRLQPEAAALNHRLGNRFKSSSAPSVLTGNLTVGTDRQPITIIRSPTDTGETVELFLTGRKFLWGDAHGVTASQGAVTEAERLIVERLVFDSPDQFVLAQLRGAAYQTIVRNLRPTDAGDDYSGPLWTMVRVDDPQTVKSAGLKSQWRLYYINSITGLVDRIECEVDGQRVEASILNWIDQTGEKIPSHIKWTTNGHFLMEYQLAAFSQAQ